jgi:hypothetical protein
VVWWLLHPRRRQDGAVGATSAGWCRGRNPGVDLVCTSTSWWANFSTSLPMAICYTILLGEYVPQKCYSGAKYCG